MHVDDVIILFPIIFCISSIVFCSYRYLYVMKLHYFYTRKVNLLIVLFDFFRKL